jgi:hypothetical protein
MVQKKQNQKQKRPPNNKFTEIEELDREIERLKPQKSSKQQTFTHFEQLPISKKTQRGKSVMLTFPRFNGF